MSTPTAVALTEDMVIQIFIDSEFDLLNYEEAVGMPDFDDHRNRMTPERMLAAVLERTNIPVTIAKDFINQHFSPRCGPPALGPPTAVALTEDMVLQTYINHESDKLNHEEAVGLPQSNSQGMTPERMLAAVVERTNIPVSIAKDFINQHFSPRYGPPALGPP